jgi:transcriptional regulator with XRE-family HTH domain
MPLSGNHQFSALIARLKLDLKARGLTQRVIADRLGVGLATVKRWLRGEGLTTARLGELCDLAGVELFDLVEAVGRASGNRIDRFSPSQERALGRDPRLFFIFFSLLNGWPPEDCERELMISHPVMAAHLQALVRLGLIDQLPGGRIRVLANRGVAWRKDGPLAKYFEARTSFVDVGASDEAMAMSDFVRLTETGVAEVKRLTEELRREIHRIAQADRRDQAAERTWYGVLFFARPLNMASIRESMSDSQSRASVR